MSVETIDYPFLEEEALKKHINVLKKLSNQNFAAIQCDQGSHENYAIVNACDHAIKLIQKELNVLFMQKEMIYAELRTKYGNNFVVDMAGGVHLLKSEHEKEMMTTGDK